MSNYFICPNCKKRLALGNGKAICFSCGLSVNLTTCSGEIADDSPQHIRDSLSLLEYIRKTRPKFVFGDAQLFDEKFKRSNVVIVQDMKDIVVGIPRVFIAYDGIPSMFLRPLLLNFTTVGHDIDRLLQNAPIPMLVSLWITLASDIERAFTFNEMKVLTALMAPTWIDCAEALRGNISTSALDWTDSELMFSYMICNKFPVIAGSEFDTVADRLSEFIVDCAKFVHEKNDLSLDVSAMERPDYIKALRNALPEFNNVNINDTSTPVGWLFATHNKIDIATLDQKDLEAIGDGYKRLWTFYGQKNSRALDRLRATGESRNIAAYIKYWKGVREKLQ